MEMTTQAKTELLTVLLDLVSQLQSGGNIDPSSLIQYLNNNDNNNNHNYNYYQGNQVGDIYTTHLDNYTGTGNGGSGSSTSNGGSGSSTSSSTKYDISEQEKAEWCREYFRRHVGEPTEAQARIIDRDIKLFGAHYWCYACQEAVAAPRPSLRYVEAICNRLFREMVDPASLGITLPF